MNFAVIRGRAAVARSLAGASLLALTTLGLASPALAQDAAADAGEGLDDIVVTARKVEENLQDVPVAVTAFSGETLANQGVPQVRDIAAFTPGFSTRDAPSNPTAFIMSLRGQVQTDVLATLEPSVGVYLDGQYISRAYGLNTELLDVQSVQILKGPQGTLFGRNTTGGAVLLQTNDPELGEFSGMVQATYGRFDERVGTAVLNLPLGDNVAIRGAVQYGQRDGYQRDINTGARFGSRETIQGRVKLLWEPTDNLSIQLSGEWYDGELEGPARVNRFTGNSWTGAAGATAIAERAIQLANPDRVAATVQPAAIGPVPRFPNYTDVQTETYGLTIALDTNWGEIRWINGYRTIVADNNVDLDGTSIARHVTQGFQDLTQYSTELQATGSLFDDRVDFAVGLTYFHEDGSDISRSNNNNAATWTQFRGIIDNDSMGIYGQATVRLTDALSFTGGLRYSIDDKGVTNQSGVYLFNQNLAVCLPTSLPTAGQCLRYRHDEFSAISWTAGLDYRFNDDVLVYAKAGRGYRSGAQQLRSLTLTDTNPAQPEIVREYEVGFKSELFDRRVRFNVAAFYNLIDGAQRSTLQAVAPNPAQTLLENADLRNIGVEAELTVAVADGLTVTATGSLIDPHYRRYIGFIGGVANLDKRDARFDGVVEEQFSIAANYRRDLGFARMNLNLNYAWQGESATNPETARTLMASGYNATQAQQIVDATTKEAAGFVNARLALAFGPQDNLEVALWGRNIFDERVFVHNLFVGGGNDYVSGMRNEPATYGVTATFRF